MVHCSSNAVPLFSFSKKITSLSTRQSRLSKTPVATVTKVSQHRLSNTFALSPPGRRRSASPSFPGVGVNWHYQPRPRYKESTLLVATLIHLGFAVGTRGTARSPGLGVHFIWADPATLQDTLQLRDDLRVRLFVLIIMLLSRSLVSRIVHPVHSTFAPAGLVKEAHSSASGCIRVQQQLWVLQDRSARIASDFHG